MSYKARSALIILILGICFDINLSSQELSFQGNDIEESGAPNVKPTLLTGEQLYTRHALAATVSALMGRIE